MEERLRDFLLLAWRMLFPLLVYEVALGLVFGAFGRRSGGVAEADVLLLTGCGAAVTAVLLGWIYRWKRGGAGRKENRRIRREDAGKRCACGVGYPVLAGIGTCLCLNHLMMLLPFVGTEWQEEVRAVYLPELSVQILCTGFVIPFAEELIFRVFAFGSLRQKMSFPFAAVLSAVYFGLFHGRLYQGIYAFLVGLLLAALYERQNSLRSVWLFHAAANLTAVLLSACGLGRAPAGMAVRLATALAGAAVTVFSFARVLQK